MRCPVLPPGDTETIMPKRKKATARKSPSAKTPSTKLQTKRDQLLTLLRRPQGTTIEHAAKTLGWHTRCAA